MVNICEVVDLFLRKPFVIKVGDVVVIKNPMKSRPYWSLGRVTPGDDDLVRSAKIRKPERKVQEHSLKHLYP